MPIYCDRIDQHNIDKVLKKVCRYDGTQLLFLESRLDQYLMTCARPPLARRKLRNDGYPQALPYFSLDDL